MHHMAQARNLEIPGSRGARPGMTACYVSTRPVLAPLAAESLWPWGSAR